MIQENTIITDGSAKFVLRTIGGGGVLSKGFIAMFDGTFQNGYPIDPDTGLADTHWHICDGTNGTPDLRDRFIVGSGSSYDVGDKGGEAKHALTTSELSERAEVFLSNQTGGTVKGYAIQAYPAGYFGEVENGRWASCNLVDAKS